MRHGAAMGRGAGGQGRDKEKKGKRRKWKKKEGAANGAQQSVILTEFMRPRE